MMAWRFINVGLMTTRAQRIALSAQVRRVRIMAIDALNSSGTHPTLLKRAVNKLLLRSAQLPVEQARSNSGLN